MIHVDRQTMRAKSGFHVLGEADSPRDSVQNVAHEHNYSVAPQLPDRTSHRIVLYLEVLVLYVVHRIMHNGITL